MMDKSMKKCGEKLVFIEGKTKWDICSGYTCIGGRMENQDSLAYIELDSRQVFVVCDGMGGHAGGCVASEIAVTTVLESLQNQSPEIPTPEVMSKAVIDANSAVYTKSKEEPSLRGMGTTLTMLVFDRDAAYVTHIGDSRIYQLRNKRRKYRTTDHSMVFEQVAMGRLTEEEARVHPRANILSRAMGVLPDVEFSITKLSYYEGDRFVLCSDGVWNSQPEGELIEMLTDDEDLDAMVHTMHSVVETLGKEKGDNHDNHTMVVVDVLHDSEYQESIFSKIKKLFNSKNQS
jgi:serine/threonine protein phosphatase PrpC